MLAIAPVNAVPPKTAQPSPKALDVATIAGPKATETPPVTAVSPIERSERTRQPEIRRPTSTPSPLDVQADELVEQPETSETSSQSRTVRNIEIDDATNSVIFQSISERTGEIVVQVPTETFLRIREYALEQAATRSSNAGGAGLAANSGASQASESTNTADTT